jgi:RimJ/RimL family protein N-acetyltransferase
MDRVLTLPIVTERLVLREFEPGDRDDVHRYSSDPEVVLYMNWGPNDDAATDDFLQRTLARRTPGPRNDWSVAVVRRSDGRVIGSGSLRPRDEHSGDIGYVFSRDAWGQGYATEMARALVGAGFAQLRLHRIWATCDVRNVGSARVLEKTGMRREGCFLQDQLQRGAWRDTYLYAILDHEWRG